MHGTCVPKPDQTLPGKSFRTQNKKETCAFILLKRVSKNKRFRKEIKLNLLAPWLFGTLNSDIRSTAAAAKPCMIPAGTPHRTKDLGGSARTRTYRERQGGEGEGDRESERETERQRDSGNNAPSHIGKLR